MVQSEIENFYKNTNVLITGGTGFIGKVLIEKLLRSTEVSTIYLFIRNKRGKDLNTRLDEIFDDVLFDRLKNEKPKYKYRIQGISGDCSLPGLGLTILDRQILINNINIVIHGAATVRFDENLKLAYAINVNGPRDILELSKQMIKLKSIVHVSTAYSNCHLKEIDEKIYKTHPITYENIENILNKLTETEVNNLTPKLIGNWPNTYTFTKALAESLIQDFGKDLPIGIFRPGVIISTYKEPIEGWVNNYYAANGVVVAAYTGSLTTFHCNPNYFGDLVPVDSCVSAILSIAWDIQRKFNEPIINKSTKIIPVYNYVSRNENPITWGEFGLMIQHSIQLFPTIKSMRLNTFSLDENYFLYKLKRFYFDYLIAFMLDCFYFVLLKNKKGKFVKTFKKIEKFSNLLNFFAKTNWNYKNENTQKLWERMNDSDKKLFPMSLTTVHWFKYFQTYFLGIRKYLLKDSLDTLDYARIRQKRFKIVGCLLNFLVNFFICIGLWLIFTKLIGLF